MAATNAHGHIPPPPAPPTGPPKGGQAMSGANGGGHGGGQQGGGHGGGHGGNPNQQPKQNIPGGQVGHGIPGGPTPGFQNLPGIPPIPGLQQPFNPGMVPGGPMVPGMPFPGAFPNQHGPQFMDQVTIYEAHEIRRKRPLSGQKPTWANTNSVLLKFEAETILKNARKTRSDHSVYDVYRNLRSDLMRTAVDELVDKRNRDETSNWHEWQLHHIELNLRPIKAGMMTATEICALTVVMRRVVKQEWSQCPGASNATSLQKKEALPTALAQLQHQVANLQISQQNQQQQQFNQQMQISQQQQLLNQQANANRINNNNPLPMNISFNNGPPNKNANAKDANARGRPRSLSPREKVNRWDMGKGGKSPPRGGNSKTRLRDPTPGPRRDNTRRSSFRKHHRGKDGSSSDESFEWVERDSSEGRRSRPASSIDSEELRYRRKDRRYRSGWYDEDEEDYWRKVGRFKSARNSRHDVRFSPPFPRSPDRGYGRRSSKTLLYNSSRPDSPNRARIEKHTHYHLNQSTSPTSPIDYSLVRRPPPLGHRHSYAAPNTLPYAPLPPLDRRASEANRYIDERRAYRAGRRDAEYDFLSSETASMNTWDDLEDQVRVKRAGVARRLDDMDLRNDREWNGYPPERRRDRY